MWLINALGTIFTNTPLAVAIQKQPDKLLSWKKEECGFLAFA